MTKKNKKILVIGGAGFIGSNIVRKLVELEQEVAVLDNFSTGKKDNISDLNIKIYEVDILNFLELNKILGGYDRICHQAALPSVPRSIQNPKETNEINIKGTLNILEASRLNSIDRVIYAGSSSFYGDAEVLLKDESLPLRPKSPYALQKAVGEHYCKLYYQLYGLKTLTTRYFNVFGPYQDANSDYSAVIPLFIKKILNNESPTINGDGSHSRDFTYIDNVVNANVKALLEEPKSWGESINVATGTSVTLKELVEKINKFLGTNVGPIFGPERAGDVKNSLANIARAKEVIDFEPIVSFDEGLKRTIDWYKDE